jgi:hypothetical protein
VSSFARYIGIDYSGAETPSASLKDLRVYLAEGDIPPVEICGMASREFGQRIEAARKRLAEGPRTDEELELNAEVNITERKAFRPSS